MTKKTVSFLISGRGSNFTAVARSIQQGKINARIGVVISSNPDAGGIARAEKMGLECVVVNRKEFTSSEDFEREIIKALVLHRTDLVVAAGFMIILSARFIRQFPSRIINIHPSLLPAFPGKDAQQQALDHGVKIAGCTCHFIDEGTDTGPIIAQSSVPVEEGETRLSLSKKILKEEHRILAETVRLYCEDRITVEGRHVHISKSQRRSNFFRKPLSVIWK